VSGLLHAAAFVGSVATELTPPPPDDAFAQARRPISNPTLFDLALPTNTVHPIFLYHTLPDQISTGGGQRIAHLRIPHRKLRRLPG
jgi:hypothetical protein